MDSRSFQIRSWTGTLPWMLIVGLLALWGCAINRAPDREAVVQSLPARGEAVEQSQDLSLEPPSFPAAPLTHQRETSVLNGEQDTSPQLPSVPEQQVGKEVVTSKMRVLPSALPIPPLKLAQEQPKYAGRPGGYAVLHANLATFEQEVLRSEVPVLVDFYASWCGPCKLLAPTLEEIAAEAPRGRVVKVDIDDSPELAARYGVKSVPSLIVFKGGQVTARQTGIASKSRLLAMLDL